MFNKIIAVFLIGLSTLVWISGCTTERSYQGAALAGAVGAGAGALIDKDNAWRGAAIGSALGGVLGGGVMEIATRAAREAARENRPVAYQSNDGFQRVEAQPTGQGSSPGCRLVREQIYQDGKLARDEMIEVCP
jgi:YMGG-like Gly-zipper